MIVQYFAIVTVFQNLDWIFLTVVYYGIAMYNKCSPFAISFNRHLIANDSIIYLNYMTICNSIKSILKINVDL